MCWLLSPRYGHVTAVSGTLFRQLSIDHNIYVCYQFKHRLQVSTLARKFDNSHRFSCGEDGRAYNHVTTQISLMDRLPNFLRHLAPLAHASREPGALLITECLDILLAYNALLYKYISCFKCNCNMKNILCFLS